MITYCYVCLQALGGLLSRRYGSRAAAEPAYVHLIVDQVVFYPRGTHYNAVG